MLHVVMFSTGLSSAVLLDKVQQKHGRENTVALFTDTKWEDEDNYRFGMQVINKLNAKQVYMCDGRTPPEIWYQSRFLVGAGGSPCTRKLKIDQTRKFVKESGRDITLYFGIDADEEHRTYAIEQRYGAMGVKCEFPLCEEPMHKLQMVDICQQEWRIKIPRMYNEGFSHANCGGRCVKAGQEHFIRLMKVWPQRFKEIADIERRFQEVTNSDICILRATRNGEKIKLPLRELEKEQDTDQIGLCWEAEMPCECMF